MGHSHLGYFPGFSSFYILRKHGPTLILVDGLLLAVLLPSAPSQAGATHPQGKNEGSFVHTFPVPL